MSASPTTISDLKALLRWFRSKRGPLYSEWDCGSLALTDDAAIVPFRRLLKILDGPEAGVRQIDIFGSATGVAEVKTMFRAYRRLHRCVRREEAASRAEWTAPIRRRNEAH